MENYLNFPIQNQVFQQMIEKDFFFFIFQVGKDVFSYSNSEFHDAGSTKGIKKASFLP